MRAPTLSLLGLLLAAGCAAPSPQAIDATTSPAQQRSIKPPPMSDPLPPERVTEPAAPVRLDRSCRTDSDCVVKNVGNCCGYAPACLNKASPTDPAAVQAQCAKSGMASVCGFAEIESCHCASGQCIAATPAIDPSQDPPEPVR